ncbi:PAP2 superfamily-domain-containing protein [Podospora fimiseda]|uniref:PAP2 superfamily-domain-containing protein n=1 Tax=Podospora fimiseda TaxID=252190 RepID=A0AAN6YRE9_9PEZI|nr:PAP2 superfamily-domain-containing protein [Podospora fimiseda]
MLDDSIRPLIDSRSISPAPTFPTRTTMDTLDLSGGSGVRRKKLSWVVGLSYIVDWVILAAVGAVGYVLGHIEPNKRPFSLDDRNIAFPYTDPETVPVWLAVVISVMFPIVIIAIISLVFVPGATVPQGTPKKLIWQRKLWELHAGWLGLALSICCSWIITNGMKNLFGKPRPDLLARCQPDLVNVADYIIGGFFRNDTSRAFENVGFLVSPKICQNKNRAVLDDGFRSYPSGHSSSASAGLVYLSLFIASKFAITIPTLAATASSSGSTDASGAFAAFPSRTRVPSVKVSGPDSYELSTRTQSGLTTTPTEYALGSKGVSKQNQKIFAARRQAASPPLYLLAIAVIPFFASIFIAGSRWWDYRHHAFDILFGYVIGLVGAIFSFRYYHLPISRGAGWAWGPRSHDKAFWAGVGSYSYATDHVRGQYRSGDEEEALSVHAHQPYGQGSGLQNRPEPPIASRKGQGAGIELRDDQDTAYSGASTGREN